MAILRKEFERQYGVDLLPVSSEDIRLGDIWEWVGLFHPILKSEMTNVALIGSQKDQDLFGNLGNAALLNSTFPDVEMKDSNTINADLKAPSINLDLSNVLSVDSVSSFQFQGIKSKNTNGQLQSDIVDFLDKLKNADYSGYADSVKHNDVIVWLFYASSVSLTVNNNLSDKAAIEAKIKSIPAVTLDVDVTNAASTTYTISSNNNCPFAAQFIKGRDL